MITLPNEYFAEDLSAIDAQQLAQLNGWQARYSQIVQWGKLIASKPELRLSEFKVPGCETAAWLGHLKQGERHYFCLDADSKIIRGLGALLLSQLQQQTAAHIVALDIHRLMHTLELDRHLSPSRSNGFLALFKRAQELAAG